MKAIALALGFVMALFGPLCFAYGFSYGYWSQRVCGKAPEWTVAL